MRGVRRTDHAPARGCPFGTGRRPILARGDDDRPGLAIVPAKLSLAFAVRSAAGAMSQPITCAPRSRAPTRSAPLPTNGSSTTSPGPMCAIRARTRPSSSGFWVG